MAQALLAAPGTEFGPCEEDCEHLDCAASRRMAAEVCPHCGRPIGYERGFGTWSGDRILRHWDCLIVAVDEGRLS